MNEESPSPETEENTMQVVPALPEKLTDGRDELNFAEFPLGTIAERVDPSVKTLVFEDKIFDKARNELISRRLTISGSDQYGLPTSTDDEVLLGLVQLAKLQRFEGRKVFFSRYQLLKLLRWPINGQSYNRIDQALNRWVGVTLYYDHAWRDKETGQWVDEKFHILERVKLYRDENERSRPKPDPFQGSFEFATSFFVWNEVVYRSFQSGNLKALDFDFVLGLRSSVTRRLYRFLDKRFYYSDSIEFDMKVLAYEHVGLSRNTPTGDLKRKLNGAIDELIERGFLKAIPKEERFRKVKAGEWKIRFERAKGAALPAPKAEAAVADAEKKPASQIEEKLVALGVKAERARKLLAAHPEAVVAEKIEVLEHLLSKNDKKVSLNPAGFLIKSIEERFQPPKDFQTAEQRKSKDEARKKRQAENEAKERRRKEREDAREADRRKVIDGYWAALTADQRKKAEQAALKDASSVAMDMIKRGGPFGEAAKKALFDEYALSALAQG